MAVMARSGSLSPLSSHLRESPLINPRLVRPELKISQVPLSSVRTKNARYSPTISPVIRAQSSPDFTPEAKFYKIEAILRSWRIPQVSSALLKMGIRGVTVSDVRGFGAQGGSTERHAGSEFYEDNFVTKVKMEVVVSKEQVEEVIDKIIEEARTGEIGDGKIFLMPISDIIRVRTGQRGEEAERMTGGRSEMISSMTSN
ncbi:nitrogen regulatory protein P-II homolog [Telopea speciosissima]|uniref:nitrogen regulatory protein P-II homolog n=1 Tax=Telopea speciosissima TaxID=54955 RepID=UPI001CC7E678|nr:nitrogen regulatory protein P-II homolog [Telopea speciosissima]